MRKAGIDRRQYLDILTSTLFDVPVYKTYGGLIADGQFEPAGFAAPLGYKDIRLTLAAADDLRVPLPLASSCATGPDLAGPWRRQARLVGDRPACGQGRRHGGGRLLILAERIPIASPAGSSNRPNRQRRSLCGPGTSPRYVYLRKGNEHDQERGQLQC